MLYPSIIYQKNLGMFDRMDWNIFMINLMYSLGEFIGRTLGRLRSQYNRPFMLIGSLLRVVFIATSFIIAFSSAPFWSNPTTIILNIFLIGLTGGFLGVAAGNTFPHRLENHEKEFGGFFYSLQINLGIGLGSLISLVAFLPLFPS